jgi:hypothetical protein
MGELIQTLFTRERNRVNVYNMDKITWQGKTFEVGDEVITNLSFCNPKEEPFEGTITEIVDLDSYYWVRIRRDDTRRLWGVFLYKNKYDIEECTIFKHK